MTSLLLVCGMTCASAQWRAGAYGGADWCERSLNGVYDYARSRSMVTGATGGVTGQYNFLDWLGIRMDLVLQQRSFNDTYSIVLDRYSYRNLYADVPLMATFAMQTGKVRAYTAMGGYAGIWASKTVISRPWKKDPVISGVGQAGRQTGFSKADRRFDAGLAGCIGLSYRIMPHMEALAECMLYYGLTDSHNTGSSQFRQPTYDTTGSVCLGVTWLFDKKN